MVRKEKEKKKQFRLVDKNIYYKFHKDYGHDKEEFITLKDEIKDLIH